MVEWRITGEDVDALSTGAAILGSGGGGDVGVGARLLRHLLTEKTLQVVPALSLDPDGVIVHVGGLGAGEVTAERLFSPVDLALAATAVADQVKGSICAVAPFEIGGLNALLAAVGALQLGLPLVDGDLMGRAFPQLTQTTLVAHGVAPVPLALASLGGDVVVVPALTAQSVQPMLAGIVAGMGGCAAIAAYPTSPGDLHRMSVRGSVSTCLELGRRFLAARAASLPVLTESLGARLHGIGRVEEIAPPRAAAPGTVTVVRSTDGAVVRVDHLDEFLATTVDGVCEASTPHVVVLIENRTRRPLRADEVRPGQVVAVCSLMPLYPWPTSARALVGPHAFGLDEMEELQ